ncbi:DEAD/DEAH box helicase [Oceanobacillus saliphilus]|uniref:DEAD/DEAH box helicase n=1 Tax=Oceanobacillus saliphilus TaxID=2925834 RepID=UPI00201E5446|nr:DEAD/DEAH box helicase [Oceanobacillus saliphilus]
MKIKLNQKIIMDRCGAVSFKRGEAYYRNGKVTLDTYNPDQIKAVVSSLEDFYVTIEKSKDGDFRVACSCPSLASFHKECQHVAAVLLFLKDENHRERTSETLVEHEPANKLAQGLVTLFEDRPLHSSGHQMHFEGREVLDVTVLCKVVNVGGQAYMFGIELKVGTVKVLHIRDFLQHIQHRKKSVLSLSFTYDPVLHCFQHETDAIITQLIQVVEDEKSYLDGLTEHDYDASRELLLIPPSSWLRLEALLTKAPRVKLENSEGLYHDFQVLDEQLPLRYEFSETKDKDYQLEVNGLHSMIILHAYRTAMIDGKLMVLKEEENQRLHELKIMLDTSGTNRITIPASQMKVFMGKVVPGLRKMGEVILSESVINRFNKTPLKAKLYLDRVKNRLLAGLEFHYDSIILNPLEDREIRQGAMIVRDIEKEDEILRIMDESSFVKTEGGYFFQNEELEYNFLYHILPTLQKLVQIYATTAVRTRIVKKPPRPKIRVKHQRERTNWLEFKFEMEGFPEKEIRHVLEAIEEKRKYYRLRNGSLMSLETREMEEIRRFLQAVPVQDEDIEKGLTVPIARGLQLIDMVEDVETFSVEDSFRQFLEGIRNPDSLDFPVPESLDQILRDYQKLGYRWMKTLASYRFGGILADDMGLGKTVQSITYIVSELAEIRSTNVPVLIVSPSSVTYNWLNELMKFAPEIQAIVLDGNVSSRKKLQRELSDVDVVITSYPLLRSDIQWFERQHFHTVFFDEAQAFKNPSTQTARAVKKVKADHRFALTGTPVENALEELWSIFHIVFPELFGGLKDYSKLTRKQISRRIRPFMLRRIKEDVVKELPEKIELTETVELHQEQKTLYAAYLAKLRHKTLKHLDKDTIRKNRIRILAGLTRLRQICCHPALFVDGYEGTSAKFDRLMKILEEARLSGRRVLIFSQFTKMLGIIGKELMYQERPYFYLDGHTPSEERVEICNRFNAGERDIFLISLKAGGTGLNLTGADTVILYDLWWNPAVEEQAADRAHRIGQKNTVQVIKLITKGTIEGKMNELQERKRHLIEEIIDPAEKLATTLTEEDIRWCLSLPEFAGNMSEDDR